MLPGTLIARDLGKAYRSGGAASHGILQALRRPDAATDRHWVVQDVNLSLRPGESLGLVGDNGAGKSTLLRLLAGALAPTRGRVQHVGRRAVMLQLGGGFHPELSGRENLRIGCAVMGLSPAETEAVLPEIIRFSELEDALDQPLRTLSSGMQLRLGFSLATAVRPDLLIVDEHLAVGDLHFQRKCMRRILDLKSSGCTLVFCSHAPFLLSEVCEQVLWMHQGRPRLLDRSSVVLNAYEQHVRERDGQAPAAPVPAPVAAPAESGEARCHLLRLELLGDLQEGVLRTGQRLVIEVEALLPEALWRRGIDLGLLLLRSDGLRCTTLLSRDEPINRIWTPLGGERYRARCVIEDLPLLAGRYSFDYGLLERGTPVVLAGAQRIASFEIHSKVLDMGLLRIEARWDPPAAASGRPAP